MDLAGEIGSMGLWSARSTSTLSEAGDLPLASGRGVGFSTILAQNTDRLSQLDADGQARVAAEEFVASSLIFPVLKQLRESNQAWGPFAPGRHEQMFSSLLDGEVASQIARASSFPLVEQLARDLRRMSEGADSPSAGEAPRAVDLEG